MLLIQKGDHYTYISSTGDDGNPGTSSGSPVKTLARALALQPNLWLGKNRIICLDDGPFAFPPEWTVGIPFGASAEPLLFVGNYTNIGTYAVTAIATNSSQNTYHNTFTVTGTPWTTDSNFGRTLTFTDGTANGDAYSVVTNSTNTVRISANEAFRLPTVGDHFTIKKPTTAFTFQPASVISCQGAANTSAGYHFAANGIRWLWVGNLDNIWLWQNGVQGWLQGCDLEMTEGEVRVQQGAKINMQGLSGLIADQSPSSSGRDGLWGCYFNGGHPAISQALTVRDSGLATGTLCCYQADAYATAMGNFYMESLWMQGSRILVERGGRLRCQLGYSRNSPDNGLCARFGGIIDTVGAYNFEVTGAAYDACIVTESSYGIFSKVTGSGNGRAGFRVYGSRALIGGSTVTGGYAKPLLIGTTAANYADAPVVDAPTLSWAGVETSDSGSWTRPFPY